MSKSIFLLDNQAVGGTITASSEAGATMAAANLLDEQRSRFWRSGVGTTSHVDLTIPTPFGAAYLALVDLNLSTAAEIRVQSWADAIDGAEPGIDTTVPPTLYINTDLLAAAYGQGPFGVGSYGANAVVTQVNVRNITLVPLGRTSIDAYWRVTFTDVNGTYQQCGLIVLAKGVEFEINLSHGWSAKRIPRSVTRESIGGQTYRQRRDSRLQLDGSFAALTEDERTALLIRLQEFDESRPFVYSIHPEASNRGLTTTIYGRFSGPTVSNPDYGISNFNFSVIEEL
jgi:hypothetical protein